jgi:predicted ATP-grasp superfamily ATP-dependent carboligase
VGGPTTLGLCTRNDVIEKTSRKLAKILGFRGAVDIDYRYDKRDGNYKILDVNPRVGATFRLITSNNGMDVVRALYLDMTAQPVSPGVLEDGRRWMTEELDLMAAVSSISKRKLTIKQYLHSLHGVEETGYFAPRDLLPFFFETLRFSTTVITSSRLLRRLSNR